MTSTLHLTPHTIFRHGQISLIDDHPACALIEAYSGYIPKKDFQEMFISLGKVVQENAISRVIFDKSKLTVFHQPSMEWYFLVWKEQMFEFGLRTHRKILPDDLVFRESARIAREKLERAYPTAKFNQMDIKYSPCLADALID